MILSRIAEFTRRYAFLRSRSFLFTLLCAAGLLIFSDLAARKNLFVIVDGNNMVVHETYSGSATVALSEAGIHISVHDDVSLPDEPLNGGSVAQVVIRRSMAVTIKADGQITRLYTLGDTVGSVLSRYGLTLGGQDMVKPPLDETVTDGMVIEVSRFSAKTVEVFEEIPFDVVRTPSKSIMVDTETVTQEGIPGQRKLTYVVSMQDGREVSRLLIDESVVKQPQNRMVTYGTGGTITLPSGEVLRYSRVLECVATAYSSEGMSGKHTAIGTIARVGAIAVDPKVIPLRSKVYVQAPNGQWVYGVAVCEDTGGAIKGNKVDLYFDTQAECYRFGRKKCLVYVLN